MARIEIMGLPFSIFSFLIMAGAGILVWRCSGNTRWRTWGFLARFAVVIYLLWYGHRVVIVWLFLAPLHI